MCISICIPQASQSMYMYIYGDERILYESLRRISSSAPKLLPDRYDESRRAGAIVRAAMLEMIGDSIENIWSRFRRRATPLVVLKGTCQDASRPRDMNTRSTCVQLFRFWLVAIKISTHFSFIQNRKPKKTSYE